MVSTHGNPCRSVRRNKGKVRMKRTKRKLARRTQLGTATLSDSKSSLDNLENPQPPPDRNDLQEEPTIKKRSLSEERPSSRIQIGQRSASVQLDSVQNHQTSSTCKVLPKPSQADVENSVTLKKTWFFPSWPVLSGLVVPKRAHNEDEGFDSFHGNNSSSSEFENDDKIEIVAPSSEDQAEGSQSTVGEDRTVSAQSDDCQNYSSKLETCGFDLFQTGHQESKGILLFNWLCNNSNC